MSTETIQVQNLWICQQDFWIHKQNVWIYKKKKKKKNLNFYMRRLVINVPARINVVLFINVLFLALRHF